MIDYLLALFVAKNLVCPKINHKMSFIDSLRTYLLPRRYVGNIYRTRYMADMCCR